MHIDILAKKKKKKKNQLCFISKKNNIDLI